MNYFDLLPLELLREIAADSEPAYKALLSCPRFARAVTPGQRIDYMIGFGHDVRVDMCCIMWRRNEKLHRIGMPAIIRDSNNEEWWVNGIRHRVDGPALTNRIGKFWYRNGLRHRDDGPSQNYTYGHKEWYHNGVLHRKDGPAIINTRGKEWWVDGVFIRARSSNK